MMGRFRPDWNIFPTFNVSSGTPASIRNGLVTSDDKSRCESYPPAKMFSAALAIGKNTSSTPGSVASRSALFDNFRLPHASITIMH